MRVTRCSIRLKAARPRPTQLSCPHAFLKQLQPNRDGTCADFDVREGKPNGRTVRRIYKDISAGGLWFWCLNDRGAFTGCRFAAMRATELKPGEMQVD
jgi:hypothetical protein